MRPGFVRLLDVAVTRTAPARRLITAMDRWLGDSNIHLTRRRMVIPGLPARADGLTILHISDLHLNDDGPHIRQVADAAAAAGPVHLTVYTGDFINDDAGIDHVARLLRLMPTALRTVAVLGNHDHFGQTYHACRNDVERLVHTLEGAGVTVLRNRVLEVKELGLHLVGLDDPVTGMADLDTALAGLPAGAPAILLSHTPDIVFAINGWRPLAVLAGHTHGGQVCLPQVGALIRVSRLPRRRQRGVQSAAGIPLHVSAGVGYSGPRLRLGAPPEVTRLSMFRSG